MLNTRWNPFEISWEGRGGEGIEAYAAAVTSVAGGPPKARRLIY